MAGRPKTTFRIAGELGKGGFGVVYLLKGDNGLKLALKTVDMRKIPEDYRERATDEAKILQSLNHRHLVHHVNSYMKQHYLCIITEFCAGGDLDKFIDHLEFRSGLPEKLIVCWLMQTASALNYMHTHRPVVLHRDLKPQNIYVTQHGDVRLGDLGLARKLAGPGDFANSQVGTILYLSPEILSQQPYNSKSDIWSLGCVFYDITGKKGGDEMGVMFLLVQVMGGRKLPLPDSYSQGLRNAITHMLMKDPSQRASAATILSLPVVQEFQRNPQKPADIINSHARNLGKRPPQIERDLSGLRGAYSAPLNQEDILVPGHVERMLADIDSGNTVGPSNAPATVTGPSSGSRPNPTQTVEGMSTNSMFLFGGGAQAAGGPAGGPAQQDDDTFYDSQNEPEMAEEHLLLQIQQCQKECTEGLGQDILEAAYGVIANVRDVSALKKDLQELLGNTLYEGFGARILRLRALEYGLYKTTMKQKT
ncbi:serine/threonine-protein kinase Nek7-like isoform X2 [Babylonia areolata]|uniref:serine/threonine-protein kinase Nek7-like isoform X2 n=1 Tax=Babylonia areolata TaxID=304850 RepID=UPI003FD136EB